MTPVRLELAALRSRVKHSTTEPLRSLCVCACVCVCVCKLADNIYGEKERFPRYRPYWIRKSAIMLVVNSQIVLNG